MSVLEESDSIGRTLYVFYMLTISSWSKCNKWLETSVSKAWYCRMIKESQWRKRMKY